LFANVRVRLNLFAYPSVHGTVKYYRWLHAVRYASASHRFFVGDRAGRLGAFLTSHFATEIPVAISVRGPQLAMAPGGMERRGAAGLHRPQRR
jgi:hypothetical protein